MKSAYLRALNFNHLYSEVCRSTCKAELVDAFYQYNIVNHTERTDITKRGGDLYISFKDEQNNTSHILIQKTKIRLYTLPYISESVYFDKYEFDDVKGDGCRTKAVSVDKTCSNFALFVTYFLQFDVNWLF